MFKVIVLSLALALSAPTTPNNDATLSLCMARYRAEQAHYVGTVRWTTQRARPHVVVGALDTSRVVWVQAIEGGSLTGTKSPEIFQFTVSDVSAYPLRFAVYSLSDKAYGEYLESCRKYQECYFGPADEGVERLTEDTFVTDAASLKRDHSCPEDSRN
ncbi:hypothetical protein DBR17_00500 [Sphingomonas sp. HMWF008]|nr:hypothetical protein DBR17_00500 [Sphingomonas sp. HMWF008]